MKEKINALYYNDKGEERSAWFNTRAAFNEWRKTLKGTVIGATLCRQQVDGTWAIVNQI